MLFTERCEQPCERGGRVDGRLLGSGFWCRGPCQLYALGRVFAIRSGKEVWFGHAYSVFTSSPMGQSMHGSLQLLSPDIHREVCVLMRSVRMYFVRVHCHDVVFYWPSTLPFFGKVMPPSDIWQNSFLCWHIIWHHVNISDITGFRSWLIRAMSRASCIYVRYTHIYTWTSNLYTYTCNVY